ncbi:MAG: HDOD domain-containing protein [Gammaproteobacteria bacterium]|nr:HDOD domain-containing protein [Gammaproteobacteria bacterium]
MALTAEALVNKSLELVSPPTTYTQLNDLMNDPNSSADDISSVINTDPALATRLLKVVNSPFYGFPSQINTISRAITIIGTRELIHLVLATSVINSFNGIPSSLININEFWRHSLACAIAAKQLAMKCGQRAAERFFLAGLLHNIGSLVIYQSMPELAREAINGAKFGNEVIYLSEQRIIGFDHTEVGHALVKAWRLPSSLEEVVRHHHTPTESEEFSLEVAIVHIADIMVSSAQLGHSGDHHIPPLDPKAWELLGLAPEVLPEILQHVTTQLDDLTSVMMSS